MLVKKQLLRLWLVTATFLIITAALVSCFSGQPVPNSTPPPNTPALVSEIHSPLSPVSPVLPESDRQIQLSDIKFSASAYQGCLLFVSNQTKDFDIFKLVDKDGNINQLTDAQGFDLDPTWSSAAAQIIFASNREAGHGFQIYIMDADGANQRLLGGLQPGDNTHPDWSPDGTQIVFQSKRDTNSNPQDDYIQIYRMNADGSNLIQLTFGSADNTGPDWSPDGSKIAFLSERSGQDEVYIMNPDGTGIERLTQIDVLKSELDWSPDGHSLVFAGSDGLYIVDVATRQSSKIDLPGFEQANINSSVWGATPKEIFFASDVTGNWNLYFLRQVEDRFEIAQIADNTAVNRTPSWFPCQ